MPAEITQNSKQYVVFTDNVYFTSPYPTKNQKTVIKLSSTSVVSYTKIEPHAQRASTISYGPFVDVPANEVCYQNNHFCQIIYVYDAILCFPYSNLFLFVRVTTYTYYYIDIRVQCALHE
jgi:hypothetical protein